MPLSHSSRSLVILALTAIGGMLLGAGALQPSIAAVENALGITSCSSGSPCIGGANSGGGPGVKGAASNYDAVVGQTSFNSTNATHAHSGVRGIDKSTSGQWNAGVKGVSPSGYGVIGQSGDTSFLSYSLPAGVLGEASLDGVVGLGINGSGVHGIFRGQVPATDSEIAGVFGESQAGTGVWGSAVQGFGTAGTSVQSDGVFGTTLNPSATSHTGAAGVSGSDSSSDGGTMNVGVAGGSNFGIGVVGSSAQGVGGDFLGGNVSKALPALSIVGNTNADLVDACNSATNPCDATHAVVTVANNGNITTTGDVTAHMIFTTGSCASGCIATGRNTSHRVRFYAPNQTLPSVEDFGEAQLVGGRAYVQLDPAFANTIDRHVAYLVFVTPEDDSRGLYVKNKSLAGFEVRENAGGRSSLPFQYRIVAKPFGDASPRLPMVNVKNAAGGTVRADQLRRMSTIPKRP